MDEYISREAVVRYLKGYSEHELNWNRNHGMVTSSVLDKAERAMSEMPAADVQPVKYGRWIRKHNSFPQRYFCTKCGGGDVGRFAFCHYCGARMDGDSE